MIEMIATEDKTLKLMDNDFILSVWAYLLPTYRLHTSSEAPNVKTTQDVDVHDLKRILRCEDIKHDTWNTRLSRARSSINEVLPKGTILSTKVEGNKLTFMFMTADSLEEAHKMIVESFESMPTIDKLLASFGLLTNEVTTV